MSLAAAIAPLLAQVNADEPVVQLPTPQIDWPALAPLLVLAVGGLLLVTVSSLTKGRVGNAFYAAWTVVCSLGAIVCSLPLWARVQGWGEVFGVSLDHDTTGPFSTVGGVYGVDGFSIFMTVVLACAVAVTALLSEGFQRREGIEGPELHVLLLLSAVGGVVMASANDLVVLFLGIETLSIAVYVLAAMHTGRLQSQEAGLKYFVLGGFSSAFLLYGIALLYGATGSTNLLDISTFLSQNIPVDNGMLVVGLGLVVVGLGFKVAAVPFHVWSPDVYDGSPTPVVAFMASGVKAAGFAALIRVFVLTFSGYEADWRPLIEALAVASLVVGAVVATVQTNVKRMLAYSSINHAGFILVAVAAVSATGTSAVLFYVASYTFLVAGTFGVLAIAGRTGDQRFGLDDLRGFGRTNPVLAALLTFFLLAQAGVPFTGGFLAKFGAVLAAADAGSAWLAVVAMVSAVVAAFLYLRIVVSLYLAADGDDPAPRLAVPTAARLGLGVCLVASLAIGIFPDLVAGPADAGQPALVLPEAPGTPEPELGLPAP